MDRWLTSPNFFKGLLEIGLHTIGMVKSESTLYFYQGHLYTLNELYQNSYPQNTAGTIISSLHIRLRPSVLVKIVFVHNKNKKREWLAIITTDIGSSSQEIAKECRLRWDILLISG